MSKPMRIHMLTFGIKWNILRGIAVQHLRCSRVVNAAKRQPFPTSKSHGVVSEKPLGFHLKSP